MCGTFGCRGVESWKLGFGGGFWRPRELVSAVLIVGWCGSEWLVIGIGG